MKSQSLRAALIAGGCIGVLVAIAEIQRSSRGTGTAGYSSVATILDGALAFAVSSLVWGLVTYAIATRINKRRLRKDPQLASGSPEVVHPARWLVVGAVIVGVVLLMGALVMSGTPKSGTAPTSAAPADTPSFESEYGACHAYGAVLINSASNSFAERPYFEILQERSQTMYPEFSQEIAAILNDAEPTSDQLAAPLITCWEDEWLSDSELQGMKAQYDAAMNGSGD